MVSLLINFLSLFFFFLNHFDRVGGLGSGLFVYCVRNVYLVYIYVT